VLDGLLKEQLRHDTLMSGMLAVYDPGKSPAHPAVFYQKAPPDTDIGWVKPCFPRIDYNLDMRYDPEHRTSGTLTVNVWCTSESKYMPEDIEKRLLALMNGTFYSVPYYSVPGEPVGYQLTTCAVWNRSDAFATSVPTMSGEPEVFGVTVTFDLTEFPPQITTDPDPVEGLNTWTYRYFPDVTVIAGRYQLPDIWRPTDEHPALYWRYIGMEADNRQTYAVNWYNGQFAAHVIAETVLERNRWIKAIVEKVQLAGEVILPDGSPMLAQRIVIRHSADPEREGQIVLTGRFGVLAQHRKETAQIPLNNAIYPNLNMEVRYDRRYNRPKEA